MQICRVTRLWRVAMPTQCQQLAHFAPEFFCVRVICRVTHLRRESAAPTQRQLLVLRTRVFFVFYFDAMRLCRVTRLWRVGVAYAVSTARNSCLHAAYGGPQTPGIPARILYSVSRIAHYRFMILDLNLLSDKGERYK